MRSVTRRSIDGAELGDVDLDPETFGIEPNQAVLHQVVTAQLAAARAGTQSTKTRADVRGGGVKPFNQKGTGRARAGSSRSPLWIWSPWSWATSTSPGGAVGTWTMSALSL